MGLLTIPRAIGFGKENKMGYNMPLTCKIIDNGFAYGCAQNLVRLKWTHCPAIDEEKIVRFSDSHKMHVLWFSGFKTLML